MNRRQALRNIGFGAGIIVIGPTTLSLLQSCKNDPEYDWQPVFLTAGHGLVLKKILDVILPTTDTPGANDVNVAQFIDAYMNEVPSPEDREEFQRAARAFSQAFKNATEKEAEKGESVDFENVVAKFLKATPAEKENFIKRNGETQDPMDKSPDTDEELFSPEEADALAFSYLKNVRDMGIWAWKTSEEIGENVLWYDPIPGEYIPCGPVEELGNGKAMSL
ncbi:gluconate 2-dehydrogenase subunit 3 family protein [Christiangramia crocea]|uniref:Gluconate 2-dehydrogenase subunit 3 family protein n=1 Tax=Christiangramia crocea TaxID=2904124 RepID=A0A9X2A630_9FLAO|nr:gluconate 2-dehydrogenase subunit 3 family protein [Gramella crocea]MCG9971969.1 gluconate 2-dehydrogenase subunit 3 family protein [Gramella crocea]